MSATAYDGIVEKRVFEMGPYTTVAGRPIKHVRVGYESIGTLNARRDNAILIIHYNRGTSHFAGRYKPDDELAGYWDAIVGPGKPLDTDRFFLVSADALCNTNARDGVTVTTGPSSLDPDTNRPYGMRFPQIQVRDLVNVQKALLESLGIAAPHAVMGASFGSMQTFEWAAAFPDLVSRIVCVIPSPFVEDYTAAYLKFMRDMITQDPDWQGGDYGSGPGPVKGLAMASRLMVLLALAPEWGQQFFARKWADPGKDPALDMGHDYASAAAIEAMAGLRLAATDANNFIYTQRANELFTLAGEPTLEAGLRHVRARVLLIPTPNDHILPIEPIRRARDLLRDQGNEVDYTEIVGPLGHLNGIFAIDQAAAAITRFLSR